MKISTLSLRLVLGLLALGLVALPITFAEGIDNHAGHGSQLSHEHPIAPSPSLYDYGLKVTDSNGEQFELSQLRGQPALVTMFFASCPDVCPLLASNLLSVYHGLTSEEQAKLRVVMVSFDEENDTIEVLRSYAKTHNLDHPGWVVARTDPNTSQFIGEFLDIRFQRISSGLYRHAPTIGFLDENGVVLAKLPSNSLNSPIFTSALKGLLSEF